MIESTTFFRLRITRFSAVAILLIILCTPMAALAVPGETNRISVGAFLTYADGETGFEVSSPGVFRSKLEFPLTGTLAQLEASTRIPVDLAGVGSGVLLRGRYARSIQVDGSSSDSDWDEGGELWQITESDADAVVISWNADVVLYVNTPVRGLASPLETGLIIGYGSEWIDYDINNAIGTTDYGATALSAFGPVAIYEQQMEGVRLGLSLKARPFEWLEAEIQGLIIPVLAAETDAYWLLRNYTFQQEAEGLGTILSARAKVIMTPRLGLVAGYRHVTMVADRDATEDGNNDGFVYRDLHIVDEITSEYQLYELGLQWAF